MGFQIPSAGALEPVALPRLDINHDCHPVGT